MRFIGDTHGQWYRYQMITKNCLTSIQVGDFGIGFCNDPNYDDSPQNRGSNHRFIRGNHDNPTLCRANPNYIGDIAVENDVFFMSGAWSIDQAMRTPGIDWWQDEELSYQALNQAIDIYEQVKPRVVVTHDAPQNIPEKMGIVSQFNVGRIKTRTAMALEAMFDIHQPECWLFGHWHKNAHSVIRGTEFYCIADQDYLDLDCI